MGERDFAHIVVCLVRLCIGVRFIYVSLGYAEKIAFFCIITKIFSVLWLCISTSVGEYMENVKSSMICKLFL